MVSQTMHMSTCMEVHTITLALCLAGPNHFMTLLPGRLALNAIITTTVLARMQEIQRAKLMPNAVYRIWQNQSVGSPIKDRPIRKQAQRKRSSKKLSSMLFARTMGVFL